MPRPHPSPIERHLLDLLERIERTQAERIGALEGRLRALETRNSEMEAQIAAQETSLTALSDSLDSFLAPPDMPSG